MSHKPVFILVAIIAITFTYPAFADTESIEINNTEHSIKYTSSGIDIQSVSADLEIISLIFQVTVIDEIGNLEITFDRTFFDAVIGSEDDSFFIIADGDAVEFEETNDEDETFEDVDWE